MKGKYNKKLIELVKLMNDGEFHDGTQLGEALQITRSAVWKMVKKLQDYDVAIESVKNKGYKLQEQLILLNPLPSSLRNLTSSLRNLPSSLRMQGSPPTSTQTDPRLRGDDDSWRGDDTYLFQSLPSTNVFLKTLRPKKLSFCIAEQQTSGKGRLGRTWHSPFGKNIYFSCLYPLQKDISELAGLSLVVSLAIVRTLQNYINDSDLGVKWPNDILYNGAKLAGVLIELQAESHGACFAIIGIGINVNMLNDDEQISQAWTSLRKITGQYIDRNELIKMLINNLMEYLDRFVNQGFEDFIKEWKLVDCLYDKQVSMQSADQKIIGIASGINSQGHLLLKMANDMMRTISSGDVNTIR